VVDVVEVVVVSTAVVDAKLGPTEGSLVDAKLGLTEGSLVDAKLGLAEGSLVFNLQIM
jgi:hypothetical protein